MMKPDIEPIAWRWRSIFNQDSWYVSIEKPTITNDQYIVEPLYAADEIERPRERCLAYKGQVEAGAARIRELEAPRRPDAYEIARHIVGHLGGNCGLHFTDVKQDDWDAITRLVASALPKETPPRPDVAGRDDVDKSGAELGRWCYENPNLAARTIEGLRAALQDQGRGALTMAERALEQAQDCIRGETPEDVSDEEAREDTLNKVREAMLACSEALARPSTATEEPSNQPKMTPLHFNLLKRGARYQYIGLSDDMMYRHGELAALGDLHRWGLAEDAKGPFPPGPPRPTPSVITAAGREALSIPSAHQNTAAGGAT